MVYGSHTTIAIVMLTTLLAVGSRRGTTVAFTPSLTKTTRHGGLVVGVGGANGGLVRDGIVSRRRYPNVVGGSSRLLMGKGGDDKQPQPKTKTQTQKNRKTPTHPPSSFPPPNFPNEPMPKNVNPSYKNSGRTPISTPVSPKPLLPITNPVLSYTMDLPTPTVICTLVTR